MKPRTLALFLTVAVGCGDSNPAESDGGVGGNGLDYRAMLAGLPEGVILPQLAALTARADALRTATADLDADPTPQTLAAAQDAWRATRIEWRRASAFGYGPVVDLRIGRSIEFLPVRMFDVERELTGTSTLTEDYVASLGVTKKGLGVLEVLIFDAMGDQEAALNALAVPRRRRYAARLGHDVARQAAALEEAWRASGGGYEADWRGAAQDDTSATLGLVVNALVEVAARVESDGLSLPLGADAGGTPKPSTVTGRVSGHARAELVARLEGLEAVYDAGDPSLSDLTRAVDPELDGLIERELADARAAIVAIPRPLAEAVVDERGPVEAALGAAQTLFRHLAADLVAAHGVTLTFSENDGD